MAEMSAEGSLIEVKQEPELQIKIELMDEPLTDCPGARDVDNSNLEQNVDFKTIEPEEFKMVKDELEDESGVEFSDIKEDPTKNTCQISKPDAYEPEVKRQRISHYEEASLEQDTHLNIALEEYIAVGAELPDEPAKSPTLSENGLRSGSEEKYILDLFESGKRSDIYFHGSGITEEIVNNKKEQFCVLKDNWSKTVFKKNNSVLLMHKSQKRIRNPNELMEFCSNHKKIVDVRVVNFEPEVKFYDWNEMSFGTKWLAREMNKLCLKLYGKSLKIKENKNQYSSTKNILPQFGSENMKGKFEVATDEEKERLKLHFKTKFSKIYKSKINCPIKSCLSRPNISKIAMQHHLVRQHYSKEIHWKYLYGRRFYKTKRKNKTKRNYTNNRKSCTLCEDSFANVEGLLVHLANKHEGLYNVMERDDMLNLINIFDNLESYKA